MILGLVSDIHANHRAAEAVLQFFGQIKVGAILFGGDAVGYNAQPGAVIACLRQADCLAVLGNHDDMCLKGTWDPGNRVVADALSHARSLLTAEDQRWLQSLPVQLEWGTADHRLLLVHGNLTDRLNGRLRPEEANRMLVPPGIRVVAVGHTHSQWMVKRRDCLILNPGSCGLPRDGDPRASCATFDTGTQEVRFFRLPYDCGEVVAENNRLGFQPQINDRLIAGQSFEAPVSIYSGEDKKLREVATALVQQGMQVRQNPGGLWVEFSDQDREQGMLMVLVLQDSEDRLLIKSVPLIRYWEPSYQLFAKAMAPEIDKSMALRFDKYGAHLSCPADRSLANTSVEEVTELCVELSQHWTEQRKKICQIA